MKIKAIFLFSLLLMVVLGGCIVKSLHPFYTDDEVIFSRDLLGSWMDADSLTWEFRQLKYSKSFLGADSLVNAYEVKNINEYGDSSFLIATLFRIEENYYIDFFPYEGTGDDSPVDWHWIPAHSLARLYIWGTGNFTFFWYDQDWLNDLFDNNRIRIAHEVVRTGIKPSDKTLILTATSRKLQKFIRKYAESYHSLGDLDQSKLKSNPDREFVFRYMNDYLEKESDNNTSVGNTGMAVNLVRAE